MRAIFVLLPLFLSASVAFCETIPSKPYVDGEILVVFRSDVSRRAQARVISEHGHSQFENLEQNQLVRVNLGADETVEEALARYSADPKVSYAQPNYRYTMAAVPNDPQYGQQWGFKNTAQSIVAGPGMTVSSIGNPGMAGKDIGIEAAWDRITDCSSIIVAVLDTGINYLHDDLALNMWNGGSNFPHHGFNYVDNIDEPMDDHGHGTHIAGTIGAAANNGVGGVGVCWRAQLMAVKVLNQFGSGSTADIVQGIRFAIDHGAKVINMSIAGSSNDASLRGAVQDAARAGVLIVAAAGNSGSDIDSGTKPDYPCVWHEPNVVCVAALDQKFNLASFSNYGANSILLAAPGVNVLSTVAGAQEKLTDTLSGGWTFASTTSSQWGYGTRSIQASNFPLIGVPVGYTGDGSANTLTVPGTDATASKTYNLLNVDVASLAVTLAIDVDGDTTASIACRGSSTPTYTIVTARDFSTEGALLQLQADISLCISSSTNLIFKETSGHFNIGGFAVLSLQINTLQLNPSTYNVFQGTSMSTPHVSGVAAMLFSYNPDYTYQDVVAALAGGGTPVSSLKGKTGSGNALNAAGSLNFIVPPSGVAASRSQ